MFFIIIIIIIIIQDLYSAKESEDTEALEDTKAPLHYATCLSNLNANL